MLGPTPKLWSPKNSIYTSVTNWGKTQISAIVWDHLYSSECSQEHSGLNNCEMEKPPGLYRDGHLAKLWKLGPCSEVTRDPTVTLTELHKSSTEMRDLAGRITVSAALHHSGLCAEAARRKPLCVKATWQTVWSFRMNLKDSEHNRNDSLVWWIKNFLGLVSGW